LALTTIAAKRGVMKDAVKNHATDTSRRETAAGLARLANADVPPQRWAKMQSFAVRLRFWLRAEFAGRELSAEQP
jgi:hypothetical protein